MKRALSNLRNFISLPASTIYRIAGFIFLAIGAGTLWGYDDSAVDAVYLTASSVAAIVCFATAEIIGFTTASAMFVSRRVETACACQPQHGSTVEPVTVDA